LRLPTETISHLDGTNVAALFELPSPGSGLATVNATPEQAGASPDDALVRAAQNGDRHAFGILYARYARIVHGILLSRVPPADAEDLLQDVFLQILPRLRSLRDISRFGGWLAAIARNRAIDFHRRAKANVELDEESTSPSSDSPSKSTPHHTAEAQAVLDAILSLPEAYRETLLLRLVEGMTGPEIAARTGLTHGSVRVNLHRGMQQLRKILGRPASTATGGAL
jgi:RNA polymerase sigma-70 factor (ECF subfamily)